MEKYICLALTLISIVLCFGISLYIVVRNRMKIATMNEYVASLQVPNLNIADRLSFNNQLLDFIDRMVELEIFNAKRFELILGAPDKKLDIDDVMKNVSQKVFESIKPDVYTSPDNIVTEQYLMSYIQKRTFIYCIQYMQNSAVDQE